MTNDKISFTFMYNDNNGSKNKFDLWIIVILLL